MSAMLLPSASVEADITTAASKEPLSPLRNKSFVASEKIRDALDRKFAASSALQVPWAPHRWMTDLSFVLASRKLCQVRMVGSHDAGTYGIGRKSAFGPDAPGVLKDAPHGAWWRSWVQWVSKPFTNGWAKTQGLSILQQLTAGSRYLDVRVAPNPNDGGRFYITHSLFSVPFSDVVQDIRQFFAEGLGGEKEIVTLDIQKILGVDLSDEAVCRSFFAELVPLERYFFPSSLSPSCRLERIWATPYRILCCLGCDCAFAPDYAHVRSSVIKSPWYNSNSALTLMNRLTGELQQELGRAAIVSPTSSSSQSSPTSRLHSSCNSNDAMKLQSSTNSNDGALSTPTKRSDSHLFPSPTSPRSTDDGDGGEGSSLYITQAVMSPFTSDVIRGIASLRRGTPRAIKDYAVRINSIALRWFRDVNLCPSSRSDILTEAVQALSAVAHDELGLVWDDDVTNTHGNILLLDFVEVGACDWYYASSSGVDPQGLRRVVQRTPVKEPRPRRGVKSDDALSGTLTLSLDAERTGKNHPPPEDALQVSGVHLCVLINLILSEKFLERIWGPSL
jgi:hypothetical protein